MKIRRIIAGVIAAACSCALALSSPEITVSLHAVTPNCNTYSGSNIGSQNYSYYYADTIQSYLTESPSGGLMRVQGDAVSKKILVEYYDSSYNFLSSKEVNAELPILGAFYETSSNYYILSGQTNYKESDSVEVYRITKYDKSWNKIASCGLYGANTYIPFDAGSARMADDGKYLLIRTCHEMYASSDGLHHQANVTIEVDMNAMKITDSYTDVMNSSYGYVSHSFNQFIKLEGNRIVAVDHGDAYPRSIVLIKYATDYTTGKFVPSWSDTCSTVDMVKFPGTIGDNATGATVGGFEISDTAYIVAGSYTGSDNYSATRNIFVSVLAKNSSTPTMKWITNYTKGSASTPHLVKIGSNSYILMWEYNDKVYYTKLDGNGNTVGSIYNMAGSLSDCVPLLYNGKLVWYTWSNETVTFYSVSTSSLSNNSKTVIVNGHDFKTEGNGGKVTQTCTRCGHKQTITVPTSFNMWWKDDSSSYYYWDSYSNPFHPGDTLGVWADITESVDNDDMVFEISDTSVASLSTNDYSNIRTVTMKKEGSFTLKVYPRYNTSAAKTYNFTVAHSYTGKITKAATCIATGVRTYTCSECSSSYTETIAKTDHSWGAYKTVKAATTAEEGLEERTCSVCNQKEQRTIAKLSSSTSSSESGGSPTSSTAPDSSQASSTTPDSSSSSSSVTTVTTSPEEVTSPVETPSGDESTPPQQSGSEQSDVSDDNSGTPADGSSDNSSNEQEPSDGADPERSEADVPDSQTEDSPSNGSLLYIIIGAAAAVLLIGGGILFAVIRRKAKRDI